ncbi:MAG TPA: Smr/MutS family protein [Pyrinomonadaceae bacterium]|jgi:DNA mismatch repair protein MutS2|nr:Smr/MutS family protein [Pyrinomonadaceae bacterium]
MITQAFKILEFDSLRALVRRQAITEMGRARIDQLAPINNPEELKRDLLCLSEVLEVRQRGARFYFEGIVNPDEAISRLRIQGTALDPLAILDLGRMCDRALAARVTILSEREGCPNLFEIVAPLATDLGKLTASLSKKILPSGELDDRASPQLAAIRRELATARSRITRSLESLMRRASEAIQEELVTVRNDRFVIPVRADHQGRIKGVAHGSSSSGATVFVEPLETIEANNELQTLRETEQREIAEILFHLSEELRRQLPAIEIAAATIAELDFINAKAVFGESFDCVVPEVAQTLVCEGGQSSQTEVCATLEFINARHPLLEENLRATGAVVPVSFKLDSDHPIMVISGANAGGKTVVLKTAGLLSLMALSALPVPAQSARVPFYRSVLADIGDHQSLAANLSTFTSHVANIASMIESCETPALVLLDEVGTGTDPEEGSGLGVAVVDHFKQRGAQVLATTHYSGLKMYAANEPGVLNASVEFDEKTLRPTYRLLVGLAGSSSGLEIAKRFGIPPGIIQSAAAHVKQSSLDAFEYLRRIKTEAEAAEELRKALEEERAATAEKFTALDRDFQQRETGRKAEFEKVLKQTVSDFEKLSRELLAKIEDRAAKTKVEREAERRAAELKREAQRAAKEMSESARKTPAPNRQKEVLPEPLRSVRVVRDGKVVSDGLSSRQDVTPTTDETEKESIEGAALEAPRELKKGDRVKLLTLGSTGIIDRIKDNEAEVRVGSLHMREKLANLELIGAEVSTSRGSGRVKPKLEDLQKRGATTELHLRSKTSDSQFRTSSELNLIGKKTDEAVDLVDKFLDEAFLSAATEVRIIHGHGTGALRKAVAEMLADHPHVARFAIAPQDQGGSGATIVELRQ